VDISERALNHARERANVVGSQITFTQLDVLKQPLPSLSFDVVVCSLFLHHLDNEQGKQLLTSMRDVTHHLLVVSDLVRNRRGLLLTELAVRLFTSSDVVRVDGARSVRAAYSIREARQLARDVGLVGADVDRQWPCHFVMACHKPGREQ